MLELNVYFWKIFNLLMQRDRKVRHRVGCSCCCWCCFDQHIIFIHNCLYVSQWVNKSTLHITKLDVENWLHYVILMTTKSMTSFFFFVRSESSHSVMEKKGMYVFFLNSWFILCMEKVKLMCLFSGVHSKRMFRVGCIPFRLLALHARVTQTTAVCTRQG